MYVKRLSHLRWTIGSKLIYFHLIFLNQVVFVFSRCYSLLSAPVAYSDPSVIDIRISMLPGHHGQVANVQSIITCGSPSPSTSGQSPSTSVPQPAAQQGLGAFSSAPSSGQFVSAPSNLPVSGGQPRYGGCPSPGCPCSDLQQSLLHTLCAAQQTLAGLYPLRSEQDVQMSAECRMTISQCLEMLQWLAAGGVHVQQVFQACVLLRATCQDVNALDSLLKWLRDGTLRRKLAVAYQLGDEPQSTLSFYVKINPIQYLLYREKLGKGFGCTANAVKYDVWQ